MRQQLLFQCDAMNECQFSRIDGTSDYKCSECGQVVKNVRVLPIHAVCGPQDEASRELRNASCAHLGAELRREQCPTCSGSVQVKVFACAIHGEATLAKPIDGVACCQRCGNYCPCSTVASNTPTTPSTIVQ